MCANKCITAFTHGVPDPQNPDQLQAIQPGFKYRECRAHIRIWFPVDRSDRRAIVILTNPHSHPTPLLTKVSRDGLDKYVDAIEAVGVLGATPVKVERGMTRY